MNVDPAPASHSQPEQTAARAASLAAQLGLKVPPILFEGDDPRAELAKGTELKYALTAQTPPRQPSDEPVLPESYGTGRMWLTARDPHCLYAHWDLKPEQQREVAAAPSPGVLALRVHLENDPAHAAVERRVALDSRHAFVEVPAAGTAYAAELGYYGPDRQWRSLTESSAVRTPREAFSTDKSAHFATFPLDASLAHNRLGDVSETAVSTAPLIAAAQKWAGLPSVQTLLDAPHLPPLASAALDIVQTAKPGAVRELLLPRGVAAGERELEPAWTPEQEAALARLIGWTARWQDMPGSAEFLESRLPGQVEAPGSTSSFEGGEMPNPEGFWLNVNAELVIYGATDPRARVTVAGREIQLRPDGTFSFRFALPDGQFELPIVAVSPQLDTRQADLQFTRATSYQGEVGAHPQDPALGKPGPENVG